MTWERELALLQRWCDETDAIALEHFRVGAMTEIKPDGTPVTAGDRAVERALRSHLADSFPDDAILGEEEGATGDGARRWIIDPIDATKNYARGIPVFATLIALQQDRQTVVAMVSAPGLGARWWAAKGEGASSSGAPIRVSGVTDLAQADVITGGDDWALGDADAYEALLKGTKRHRAFGDFWGHMLVAQGSAEAMVEFAPLAPWDIAAPALIVTEAGGRCTAMDGGPPVGGATVSSNGALHDEVLASLRAR